jgi:hypothetical protein
MRWNQGRAEVEAMIAAGEIERVHPDRGRSDDMLDEARTHLDSECAGAGTPSSTARVRRRRSPPKRFVKTP